MEEREKPVSEDPLGCGGEASAGSAAGPGGSGEPVLSF